MSLRLSHKVFLVASVAIFGVAALAGTSIYHLFGLRHAALALARDIHQSSLSADFDAAVTRAAAEAVAALATGGNPIYAEEADEALARARTALDALEATMTGYESEPEYERLHRSVLDRQRQVLRQITEAVERATPLYGSRDEVVIQQAMGDLFAYEALADPMRGEITELLRHEGAEYEQAIQRSLAGAMYSAAGTVVLFALLAVGVLLSIRRGVVAPLVQLARTAGAVARGATDRSVPVTSTDEIGDLQRSFNWMVRDLATQHAALEERNHQLAEAIAEAQRERHVAEEASRAKSQFLGNVSHEVRTPLHGVLGLTELLLATRLSPEQRHFVTTIDQSGRELLQIINNILDLSRIEANRLELHRAAFALQAMAADVARLFGAAALRKGLSLRWEVAPDVPRHAAGDPMRVRQVLTNLVDNSIKFTDAGSVRIIVEREAPGPQDDGRVTLRFTVRDTGVGVPEHVRDRVFDVFVQGDSSNTRRHGGTGLGLAIARKLTLLMGGRIGFDNVPGGGAAFWFTVPLEPVDAEEVTAAQPELQAVPAVPAVPAPTQMTRGAGSILLVEDNDTNRAVALAMLRSLGLRADVAVDGNEAVRALSQNGYDLILMDCQMPDMDGIETTRVIRAQEAELAGRVSFMSDMQGIPIIAVTANAASSNRERCLAAGMNDFLAKPFTLDMLAAALARWLPDGREPIHRPAPGSDDHPLAAETIDRLRALQGDDDTDFLERLVADYCRNADQYIETMRAAAAGSDAGVLEQVAHKLKSSSACVGALHLAGRCGEIEEMARTGDLGESDLALDALADEVARVRHALRATFPASASR